MGVDWLWEERLDDNMVLVVVASDRHALAHVCLLLERLIGLAG